jgi:hypothetical protein
MGMDVVVDLRTGAVHLADAADLEHFAVQAVAPPGGSGGPGEGDGALGALAAALSLHQAGFVEPDGSVRVAPAAVRRLARDDVGLPEGWESGFASMLDHAATRGWVAEDGSIRAHVEWQEAS